jgi:hypothetical protein
VGTVLSPNVQLLSQMSSICIFINHLRIMIVDGVEQRGTQSLAIPFTVPEVSEYKPIRRLFYYTYMVTLEILGR